MKFKEHALKGLDKHGVYVTFVTGEPAVTAVKSYFSESTNLFSAAPEMLAFLEKTLEENRASDGFGFKLDIYTLARLIEKANGRTRISE